MTVDNFIKTYTEDNIFGEKLEIGKTTLRNYIKSNKDDLEKENIVKLTKKISTVGITIIDSEKLYKKLK